MDVRMRQRKVSVRMAPWFGNPTCPFALLRVGREDPLMSRPTQVPREAISLKTGEVYLLYPH